MSTAEPCGKATWEAHAEWEIKSGSKPYMLAVTIEPAEVGGTHQDPWVQLPVPVQDTQSHPLGLQVLTQLAEAPWAQNSMDQSAAICQISSTSAEADNPAYSTSGQNWYRVAGITTLPRNFHSRFSIYKKSGISHNHKFSSLMPQLVFWIVVRSSKSWRVCGVGIFV